jgi:hypothetical protein
MFGGAEYCSFVKFAIPGKMMLTPVILPALTSIVSVPENVPLEGAEYVPKTENVVA